MRAAMLKKVANSANTFSDDEVAWLLENIGNPEAAIRDGIVYTLLCRGIDTGGLTPAQFLFLAAHTKNENLIFYHPEAGLPATVTRTFAALLNGELILADGQPTSPYYHLLPAETREYFFVVALAYLAQETNRTGYSERYGWVHGFAHGGDFLASVVQHDLFAATRMADVSATLLAVVKKSTTPFLDGEERRLAEVIYQALLSGKLAQKDFAQWLQGLTFPLVENADYYQLALFENMLAYVYFHALDHLVLADELLQAMLHYLKNY